MAVLRDGVELPLPPSRKVRALVAYLALAPRAPSREQLCELLWAVPSDPRGELRGCLSKMRAVLDTPGRRRLLSDGALVRLDIDGVDVDAKAVDGAIQQGLQDLPAGALRELAGLFRGEFLEGLEVDNSPQFTGWLVAQRRRFRAAHVAVLEAWASHLPPDGDETLAVLAQWLQLAPFDRRAHGLLLAALARRGAWQEGEDHLAAAVRSFESEGLDPGPLVGAWRQARHSMKTVQAEPAPALVLPEAAVPQTPRRASIAVMPFDAEPPDGPGRGGMADGLVHDVIVRLAKLRALFVIAQGTVFALGRRQVGPEEAGRLLHVDYVAAGRLQRPADRLVVTVELVETRSARVVWTEVFDEPLDEGLAVLDAIGQRIVASIAGEVETAERNRALLKPPESLDAWESYHRGLWHMYRFRREDNERAQHFFLTAARLDPTFARAHAGLSFTHFQNVFQQWGEREAETALALHEAARSIGLDDRDPAAHWAMGRALWLHGEVAPSLAELQSAVSLSPNFALGHYALAFVNSQSGDPAAAIEASDQSRQLSPFDPLMFGFMGARAMALVRLGRYEEAAEWALKAAARPNAHVHIQALAAHCLALAGRLPEARGFALAVRRQQGDYGAAAFHAAFHFREDALAVFHRAAACLGW
jgi:DNA-binding SARP family transcriptional activator